MKTHKPFKTGPIFNKEKEYLKILNNPAKFKELKELVNTMSSSTEKIVKPDNLNDWYMYVISILPKIDKANEFITKLGDIVHEYTNE